MRLSSPPDDLYNVNSKIVLALGLVLLLFVNCWFYHDYKDDVSKEINVINKQLSIQRELLDEGMSLMFNSVYLQRSWIQDKFNSTREYYVKGSIVDSIAYNSNNNISSLDGHIPKDEYSYGNFFIKGDIKRLDSKTLKEIEVMKDVFDLQHFLRENSSFATWSTYYTGDYITIYPFGTSEENIQDDGELFTAVDQAIEQLNNENNREVLKTGWETDIFFDHTGQILMFSKNLPVLRDDKVVGIIAVNIAVDNIQKYVKKSGEMDVYITDSSNNVAYCDGIKTDSITTLQEVFANRYELEDIETILEEDIARKINGRYFLTTELQNAEWKLIVAVPESVIESTIYKRYAEYAAANLFIIVSIALICLLLSKYSKKATEIAKLKDEFLMTVSHDLKSPLASIIGFNEMIENKLEGRIFPPVTPERQKIDRAVQRIRRNIAIIEKEGVRLTELINNLLDLSILEYREFVLKREPADVQQILEDGFEAVQALIKSKGLNCFIEADPDLPLVFADRERIIQLLVNLLSNAAKFTEDGYIKCSAREGHDRVIFCVEDTGRGIAKKHQDHIFQKFIKAEQKGGTGLGLAICKHIADKHGGRIWVESEKGKGSRFFFEIPVYKA